MSVFVVGINHQSAPLSVLEQLAIPEPRLEKALAHLKHTEHVQEAVVLSTCNRIEVYASGETFHGAYENVRNFLADFSYIPLGDFVNHLYSKFGTQAAEHLFRVVSGLDSAVLGEAEIQGQVKRAWEAAQGENVVGPELNLLFRDSLKTGKKVRSQTKIGAEKISSAFAAGIALAQKHHGDLSGRTALMLGTGEVGRTGVQLLSGLGMAEVLVASHTWERADSLAGSVGARAIHLDQLHEALREVDFLFSASGNATLVLERSELAKLMEHRRQAGSSDQASQPDQAGQPDQASPSDQPKPLVIMDLAVPRDIDPTAADLEGLEIYDLEDIQKFARSKLEGSEAEISRAQDIVAQELEDYIQHSAITSVAPLIVEFRRKICDISQLEFDRFESDLASLSDEQRESVEALVHGIVNKVLHHPTTRIRESPEAELLGSALRTLFDLEAESPGTGPDADSDADSDVGSDAGPDDQAQA